MKTLFSALALAGMAALGGNAAAAQPVIGALIRNLDDQFLGDYGSNLKKIAAAKGAELKLMDAHGDMATQLDQLNTLLSQGVKYFVVVPVVTEGSDQIAQAIAAKGGGAAFSNTAPTVKALKTGRNFFLASSPESVAGQIQAGIVDDYFKKFPAKLGPGKSINLLMLLGQLGHPAQIYRTQAVLASLQQKGYKVNVLAKDTANWQPEEAQQKMDAWLNAYRGKFNLVLANNDSMALGAVESLVTAKYVDDPARPGVDVDGDGTSLKVPVIGVDATPVALRSMAEKKLYATVLQDAGEQSATAFELAYLMATKGAVGGATVRGYKPLAVAIDEAPANNAAIVGQVYLVPFKAVTQENYKSFTKK
ncbi:substrate-binding domain-containing protein [Janthinobacterium sp. GB1R12]|uniref:substrate-binding domain-containing protein n=1 Tax=Janthinobacterium sp. GB1R12 TaxID=3424190 RepID=UPI003F2572D5